jgi:HPt (histidine-containing phosphotransfer) domain-containing protein
MVYHVLVLIENGRFDYESSDFSITQASFDDGLGQIEETTDVILVDLDDARGYSIIEKIQHNIFFRQKSILGFSANGECSSGCLIEVIVLPLPPDMLQTVLRHHAKTHRQRMDDFRQEQILWRSQFLDSYLRELLSSLQELENAVQSKNTHAIKQWAHTKKTSSYSYGLMNLTALCMQIEDAANVDSPCWDTISALVASVREEFERVRSEK